MHSGGMEQNRSRRFEKRTFENTNFYSALEKARYKNGCTDVYEIITYIHIVYARMYVIIHHFHFVIKLLVLA